jgi:hypothetical protein
MAMDLLGRPAGSQSTPAGVKISFKLPNDKKEKLFRRWAVEHGAVITTGTVRPEACRCSRLPRKCRGSSK